MYRAYSRRLAERLTQNGSRVWYYSFEYGTASHVLDQAMAFDCAAADDSQFPGLERGERENMAEILYETFARFFETGDPGTPAGIEWRPLCEDRSVMAFFRLSFAPAAEGAGDASGFSPVGIPAGRVTGRDHERIAERSFQKFIKKSYISSEIRT